MLVEFLRLRQSAAALAACPGLRSSIGANLAALRTLADSRYTAMRRQVILNLHTSTMLSTWLQFVCCCERGQFGRTAMAHPPNTKKSVDQSILSLAHTIAADVFPSAFTPNPLIVFFEPPVQASQVSQCCSECEGLIPDRPTSARGDPPSEEEKAEARRFPQGRYQVSPGPIVIRGGFASVDLDIKQDETRGAPRLCETSHAG